MNTEHNIKVEYTHYFILKLTGPLFTILEYSTSNNDDDSIRKKIRKFKLLSCSEVKKFILRLDAIKNANIDYYNDKPLIQKFDYNENRRYV